MFLSILCQWQLIPTHACSLNNEIINPAERTTQARLCLGRYNRNNTRVSITVYGCYVHVG